MEKQAFTIDGIEYFTTPLDGIQGIPIVTEIMALASEPILALVKAHVAGTGNSGEDWQALLADLDTAALAKSMREGLQRLGARPDILLLLFSRTVRAGQPLDNPTAFKMAYQGKWMELGKALVEIVKINQFVPF